MQFKYKFVIIKNEIGIHQTFEQPNTLKAAKKNDNLNSKKEHKAINMQLTLKRVSARHLF